MSAVKIRNLTFKYPRHEPLLAHVNATFKAGTLTLITGPSGAGKSTLLKLMARLLPEKALSAGTITYGTHRLASIPADRLSRCVAMMFQDPNFQFAMRTVKHELIFTLENRRTPATQIPARVDRILRANRLTRFRNRRLMTLSGGEKQRVALALITALDPQVILLDEPFTNVDGPSRRRIMRKLVHLKARGKTIVIVDHDLHGYRSVTDQLLILRDRWLAPAHFSAFENQLTQHIYRWNRPAAEAKPLYQLSRFSVGYRRPLITAARFGFFANHATLITGANGSGKSTLFRALLKLKPYRGRISYAGRNVQSLKNRRYYRHVNLIWQEATDQFLEITVKQELELTINNACHGYYSRATVKHWLEATRLDRHLDQVVYSLSGGQRRSLQIIEGLLNGAPVLLMDEPFQSLDHHLIRFFKGLLRAAVKRDRRTLIVISHQIAPVADLFDYHVGLNRGRLRYLRGLDS